MRKRSCARPCTCLRGAILALGALALLGSACGDDSGNANNNGNNNTNVNDNGNGNGNNNNTPPGPNCRGGLTPTQTIGNWDVVPLQRVSSAFNVGVVAFHEEGVDVVFSVEGQEATRVTEPTLNPRTGVVEYWFTWDPADHADGPVTLGATIEPDCDGHLPRELDPLILNANAGGSQDNPAERWVDCQAGDDNTGDGSESAPYATIEKAFVEVGDGGTVLLEAGDCYALTADLPSADYTLWTTVRPAPGVDRADVSILTYGPDDSSTGRFGEDMVRWQDVRLYKDVDPGYSTLFYLESGHHVWFDGAELFDARGQWNGGQPLNGNDPWAAYYTDAYIHDLQNAGHHFGRDVVLENIGSDVFRGASGLMSIHLLVRGIDRGTTDAHPDFFQFYNPDSTVDNVVVYNARVYDMGAQGIFGGPGQMRNIAFVNLLMEKDPADSALTSQITGDWNHVLLWHVTTVDSGFMLRETDQLDNWFIQNCLFHTLHSGDATALPGFTIEHNHVAELVWDQPEPMGLYPSVGDPGFVDEANDDYHLRSDSPAALAGAPLPGNPVDAEGNPYHAETPSLGCFAR